MPKYDPNWNQLKDRYDALSGASKQAVTMWYDDMLAWADMPPDAQAFVEALRTEITPWMPSHA
jgi:hypothetical protein